MTEYDVIIVGARIAGSVLASHLGDRGHSVLLLDRDTFPSDTLSTHFFRAPAIRVFDSIGVLDEIEAGAPRLTVDYNVIDGTVFPEPLDEPEDYPYYLCVRRITLDDILVRRAQATKGVEMHEGAVATDMLWEDERCVGVKYREEDRLEARARVVIGADGVRSTVARKVGPEAEDERPVERTMYYGYYRGVPAKEGPAAEFHFLGNQLVYCIPTNDDLTLLAASVPVEEFDEFRSDPEGKLMSVLNKMTELAPRLTDAEREGPIKGTGTIPCFRRVPNGPGWALVGDAGMTLDPWSGQGIDQGSTHATMLAEHLDAFLTGVSDWESAMEAYHEERNEFSKKIYRRTADFAPDLRPMTQKALERRGLA